MTRERAKELLPIITAYAEGKDVFLEGRFILEPDFTSTEGIYSIKSEPRLRPWTAEEVPDCFVRCKGDDRPLRMRILAVSKEIVFFMDAEGFPAKRSFEFLLNGYEHSTDGGKTWKPCGVLEGGE